jgi:hypothetical protein
MEVEAFLADAVQAVGGKLFALGMGWNVLSTARFPARHDRVALGVLVRMPGPEATLAHKLTVRLLDSAGSERALGRGPDGGEVRELEAPFSVPSATGEATATFALNFDGLVFDEAGTYTFVLLVDGDECKRLAFRVQTPPAPPPAEYRAGGYL